jgi:hypothetical protein
MSSVAVRDCVGRSGGLLALCWEPAKAMHSAPARETHWEPAMAPMFPQAVWGSLCWEPARAQPWAPASEGNPNPVKGAHHGHLQRVVLDLQRLQHVDHQAAEVFGSRVVVLVDAVPEAHESHAVLLRLHLAHKLRHLPTAQSACDDIAAAYLPISPLLDCASGVYEKTGDSVR